MIKVLHFERLFGNICLTLDLPMVSVSLLLMVTRMVFQQKIINIFNEILNPQFQLI